MISNRVSDGIPPQRNILNMTIPILMYFCIFFLKLQLYQPYERACHPPNLFPTVYRRIYCHTFLMLSNQMSRYKIKCIKIHFFDLYFLFVSGV